MIRLRPRCVLWVDGDPSAQGSKTAVVGRDGRARVIEGRRSSGRKRHKAWRQALADTVAAWIDAGGRPVLDEGRHPVPLWCHVVFVKPRPSGRLVSARWWATRPDGDKLQRSTWDGLAGLVPDDGRFAWFQGEKRYSAPADGVRGAYVALGVLDVDPPRIAVRGVAFARPDIDPPFTI